MATEDRNSVSVYALDFAAYCYGAADHTADAIPRRSSVSVPGIGTASPYVRSVVMVESWQSSLATERTILEGHLLAAERHVAAGEEHIERQRRVVAKRQREGVDASEAMDVLMQFESLQARHIATRDLLRKELGL